MTRRTAVLLAGAALLLGLAAGRVDLPETQPSRVTETARQADTDLDPATLRLLRRYQAAAETCP
jgi:hypothetical protein